VRNRRSGLATAAIIVAASLVPNHASAAQLPPAGPYPDAECNWDSRMDIYIAPNGTMFECVCEWLFDSEDCGWFEVPPAKATRIRQRARITLHVRALPRMVVIAWRA